MIQTIEMGPAKDEEPATAIWRSIPNYSEILAGLFDVVDAAQERGKAAIQSIGNTALEIVDLAS
jgi:hypothetical protein